MSTEANNRKIVTTITLDEESLSGIDSARAALRPIPNRSKMIRMVIKFYLENHERWDSQQREVEQSWP